MLKGKFKPWKKYNMTRKFRPTQCPNCVNYSELYGCYYSDGFIGFAVRKCPYYEPLGDLNV